MDDTKLGEVCRHGSLKRKCEICERDEGIAHLEEKLAEAKKIIEDACQMEEELVETKQELAEAKKEIDKQKQIGKDYVEWSDKAYDGKVEKLEAQSAEITRLKQELAEANLEIERQADINEALVAYNKAKSTTISECEKTLNKYHSPTCKSEDWDKPDDIRELCDCELEGVLASIRKLKEGVLD